MCLGVTSPESSCRRSIAVRPRAAKRWFRWAAASFPGQHGQCHRDDGVVVPAQRRRNAWLRFSDTKGSDHRRIPGAARGWHDRHLAVAGLPLRAAAHALPVLLSPGGPADDDDAATRRAGCVALRHRPECRGPHAVHSCKSRSGTLDWAADAGKSTDLLDWMRHNVTGDGHVATTNPALVHLRTGRRTVAMDDPAANWQRWRSMGVSLPRVPHDGAPAGRRLSLQGALPDQSAMACGSSKSERRCTIALRLQTSSTSTPARSAFAAAMIFVCRCAGTSS
jgi:hypothetical protein